MPTLSLPYLGAALLALLSAGFLCRLRAAAGAKRGIALAGSGFAALCLTLAAIELERSAAPKLYDPLLRFLESDRIDALPMAFFAALSFGIILLAPKRDSDGSALCGMLFLAFATEFAYASANLLFLAIAWTLTAAPFALGMFGANPARKVVSGFLAGSSLALWGAVICLYVSSMGTNSAALAKLSQINSWAELLQALGEFSVSSSVAELSHANSAVVWLAIAAVVLRKGIFPVHSWVITAFEHGPLLPTALLFNGHLGGLLILRAEMEHLPAVAQNALDILHTLALATALAASLRAFAEKKPRRMLAFVAISQAAFILAGVTTANPLGVTGALAHWLAVTAASSGLLAILRILEVRVSHVVDPSSQLGLAVKAPRLATFFLLCSLALIGLPGTLGYCAEDLLFHGALEAHPWLGLALPIATAFNAINLYRLFSILFLGVVPKNVVDIPDALPRERWPLTFGVAFLILGGLLPGRLIEMTYVMRAAPQHEEASSSAPAHYKTEK